MHKGYSRRRFIQKKFSFIAGFLGMGFILNGCDQKKSTPKENKSGAAVDPCNDFSEASKKDLRTREKLGYVNESPIADMTCDKCNLWLPPAANNQCGGCMLFKGPVFPSGYCTYWTARQG